MIRNSKKKRNRLPKPAKWQRPLRFEKLYRKQLRKFLWLLTEDIRAELYPIIEQAIQENDYLVRTDSWVSNVQTKIQELKGRFINYVSSRLGNQFTLLGESVWRFNFGQFSKVVQSVTGSSPLVVKQTWLPSTLEKFVAENTNLITNMTQTQMDKIGDMVLRNVQKGLRYKELSKEIESQMGVSRKRADLIARDQVSKLNGQLTKQNQQSIGAKRYIWRTSRDERVRGNPDGLYPKAEYSHYDRDGQEFSWDNPPEDGHPGEPINCRCYAEMIFTDILETNE